MSDHHTLIVVGSRYRLECPGVTDDCRAYVDCLEGCCTVPREYNFTTDAALGHGVHHRYAGEPGRGSWLAATDDCAYVANEVAEMASEILLNGISLPSGRYLVRPSYDPDGGGFDLGFTGAGRIQVLGDYFHGWLPVPAVYVGRQAPRFGRSRWHNPFKPGQTTPATWTPPFGSVHVRDLDHALALFRELAAASPTYQQEARAELAGRLIACWCSPEVRCHGDHLLELANERLGAGRC